MNARPGTVGTKYYDYTSVRAVYTRECDTAVKLWRVEEEEE